jgi:hypothetical protein
MSIEPILVNAMKSPLSNDDILKICDGKCKVIKYEELRDMMTLDEMFHPHKAVVILYETEHNYGHWVAMLKNPGDKPGIVEFFDSYGMKPDTELKMIDSYYRKMSGQNQPILTWLIESSPYQCEWNEYDFQSKRRNVNSCGRWAALRVKWRSVPLDKFQNFFVLAEDKWPSDILVSALTLDH